MPGYISQNFGIQFTLYLVQGALCLGLIVCLALKETAPVTVVHADASEPVQA